MSASGRVAEPLSGNTNDCLRATGPLRGSLTDPFAAGVGVAARLTPLRVRSRRTGARRSPGELGSRVGRGYPNAPRSRAAAERSDLGSSARWCSPRRRPRPPFSPVLRYRLARYHARMVPNAGFWALYLRDAFIPTIDAFRSTLTRRVLDSLSGIENDAETFADDEYARLGSEPSDGSVDLGDIAEKANNNAIIYYQTLHGLRQGILNLLAAGLYHLLEQQQQAFVSGQAPHQRSAKFCAFLRDHGVDCSTFSCADRIRELRLVANVAKHGAGRSAKELAALRPDLFEPQEVAVSPPTGGRSRPEQAISAATTAMSPISGDDLYVSADDLEDWCDSVKAFWEELSEHLERQQHESK